MTILNYKYDKISSHKVLTIKYRIPYRIPKSLVFKKPYVCR